MLTPFSGKCNMRKNLIQIEANMLWFFFTCFSGVCREHGKVYTVYLITVCKKNADGTEKSWDVYRRYSDFHDLHMILQEKVSQSRRQMLEYQISLAHSVL